MEITYRVRVNKTELWKGTRKRTYWVRWTIDGKRWKEGFSTSAQAESFRAELVRAANTGQAFDVATGRPVSMARKKEAQSWYAFACDYIDMKWPHAAATYRRSMAEALQTVTLALLATRRGIPDERVLRSALLRHAFNTQHRDDPDLPEESARALRWTAKNTLPVSALSEPRVMRAALDAIARRLDGKPASATVVNRKRAVLYNALDYAVELNLLETNPIPNVKWKAPKASHAIDRRTVMNPIQARSVLRSVGDLGRSGRRLAAFFAVMYYAALRPEEAVNLRKSNLSLPEEGWGDLIISHATPHAGRRWTDSGDIRDDRGLKHRAVGDSRTVPCAPELTAILHEHLTTFGAGEDGRLFLGEQGGVVPNITIKRTWERARAATFTEDVRTTPLAATPYSLRHTAVSTWLNAGVPPTLVAQWAGHSVEVLLNVYAKCLTGQDVIARRQIEHALGYRGST